MSHNIFDYQQLPVLSDALQDLDTIPVNNVSVNPDAQEKLTVQALRGAMLYSSPVGAYVGPDGVANEVAFGNFRIRMNPANNATEISTIAGAESAEIYRFAAWGAGAFDNTNYNALALNSTTWTVVDPLVLSAGDDMVRYWISRTNLADREWYEVLVWRPTLGKTCIEASRKGFQGPASPIVDKDFFESVVTGTPPDGINDLTEGIRRTGFVGVGGVNPSSALHTTSLATKWVNHFGPANYATNNLDHSLRFAQGCPAVGVTLHTASTVPGQMITISNSSLFAQTITNPPIPLNGIGTYPTLAIGDSVTIQSIGGFWCVIDSGTSAAASGFDFFRSGGGVTGPDGVNDYTEAITHNGFLGLGQIAAPQCPLEITPPGQRNDVIRISGIGSPNPHQFFGFGWNTDVLRYQTPGSFGAHAFYHGIDPTSSRQQARIEREKLTIGDPLSSSNTGHWTIENTGDNGSVSFRSPDAAAGINKIQAQIFCDGYSGYTGVSGAGFDFRTAAYTANSVLASRLLISASGDIMISDQSAPYGVGTGSNALLTVNGSLRVRGGAIQPIGGGRQTGGIVFGAGPAAGGLDPTGGSLGDSDGGITSSQDGAIDIYSNGSLNARFSGGQAFKPGGGTWSATSDSRTKKIVTKLTGGGWLDKVLQLQPVDFEYNGLAGTRSGTTYTGLVAQDVQKIFPTWITESQEKIDGTPVLQIDTSPLVYALVECVRELKLEIDKLKAGISGATTTVVTSPPGTTATTAPLSVNMTKVSRLTLMAEPQLTAIGFTAAQAKMFIAGSTAIRTGVASGALLEADALRLLSSLLGSIGLTLSGVLSKL